MVLSKPCPQPKRKEKGRRRKNYIKWITLLPKVEMKAGIRVGTDPGF